MDRITIYFSFIIDRKDNGEYIKNKEKRGLMSVTAGAMATVSSDIQ